MSQYVKCVFPFLPKEKPFWMSSSSFADRLSIHHSHHKWRITFCNINACIYSNLQISNLPGLCWYYIPGSTQHSVEAMSGKMFLTENGKTFLLRPRPIKNFVNLSSNKDQNGISSIFKKMQTKKFFSINSRNKTKTFLVKF